MDISRTSRRRITCLYALSLACGLGAFASQVEGQTASAHPANRSSAGATSTSPEAAVVTNRELSERVQAVLRAEPNLYARHVDVTIKGDAVVLSGIVFSDWELQDALRIARNAAGNRPVVDSLSLDRDFEH